jgi:hypothetical protein
MPEDYCIGGMIMGRRKWMNDGWRMRERDVGGSEMDELRSSFLIYLIVFFRGFLSYKALFYFDFRFSFFVFRFSFFVVRFSLLCS